MAGNGVDVMRFLQQVKRLDSSDRELTQKDLPQTPVDFSTEHGQIKYLP